MQKLSINKLLLTNKHVNNYTKLLLILSSLDYYEDYYIPNKKIMNILKINDKKNIRILLHQLENDNVIKLFYKRKKRYFIFLSNVKNENKNENSQLFDYNWLEED